MVRPPVQLLLVLDVDKSPPLDVVESLLPPARLRLATRRLSECGAPVVRRFPPDRAPIDWSGLAQATERLAEWARTEASVDGRAVECYVAGHAPLATFVHLGLALSAWAGSLAIANPRKEGSWVLAPLQLPGGGDPGPYFEAEAVHGLASAPSELDGCVAIFVSAGPLPLRDEVRAALHEQGECLGALVEFRRPSPQDLDGVSTPRVAAQLASAFSQLPGLYPHASSFAFFVAGPAQLAFAVGRAINPQMFKKVWVADLAQGVYDLGLSLPWVGRSSPSIPQSAGEVLARREVLDRINQGLQRLKDHLHEDDLPPSEFPLTTTARARLLTDLRAIPRVELASSDTEPFRLSVLQGRLVLSDGLLEALRALDAEAQSLVGQQLVLHEVFHLSQGLRSADYHGVGRAGFVLEEIDFWADAFALGALSALAVRDGGAAAQREVARVTSGLIDVALNGVASFDRLEQGSQLTLLAERRLRRYLLWSLQRARASTLRSPAHLWQLFSDRVVIEIAPLDSYLDARFDKIVRRGISGHSELLLSLRAQLVREPNTPSLDPATLVDAVRRFDLATLQTAMEYVIERHASWLTPWRI